MRGNNIDSVRHPRTCDICDVSVLFVNALGEIGVCGGLGKIDKEFPGMSWVSNTIMFNVERIPRRLTHQWPIISEW
jgi:hypothetical protein